MRGHGTLRSVEPLAWRRPSRGLSLELVFPYLSTSMDSVAWRLTPSGIFSVSSAYRALFRGPSLPWTTPLWKAHLPLKTKIFVWQMLRDCLPSGVEVAKRHGLGDGLCPLCGIPESGTHIMFTCPATWFLWSFDQEALGPAW
jgi:hypothetical protein